MLKLSAFVFMQAVTHDDVIFNRHLERNTGYSTRYVTYQLFAGHVHIITYKIMVLLITTLRNDYPDVINIVKGCRTVPAIKCTERVLFCYSYKSFSVQ